MRAQSSAAVWIQPCQVLQYVLQVFKVLSVLEVSGVRLLRAV